MPSLTADLPAALPAELPGTRVLLAVAPLVLLVLALDIYCLVDLVRARSVRYLPRVAWAFVVVCLSAPFGALAYLVWGRERHDRHPDGLTDAEIAEAREAERADRAAAR